MNDQPRRRRHEANPRAAFTMFELLIVLAVLAVMAATVAISLSAFT